MVGSGLKDVEVQTARIVVKHPAQRARLRSSTPLDPAARQQAAARLTGGGCGQAGSPGVLQSQFETALLQATHRSASNIRPD